MLSRQFSGIRWVASLLLMLLLVNGICMPVAARGPISDTESGARAITLGGHHSCALTGEGNVWCWGRNFYGQLGDGSITNRLSPVQVSGIQGQAYLIDAGGYHSCALTCEGSVQCWGRNSHGQLGDDSNLGSPVPVAVSGLDQGIVAMALGGYHSCALTDAGQVKCWGRNNYGQLGDGTTENRSVPIDVNGLDSPAIAVSAGSLHSCALTAEGTVKCWGRNTFGQLGDGTTTRRLLPVDVLGLQEDISVLSSGGHHSCVLTAHGYVKCWGHNWYGQLGDGTTVRRFTPVDVRDLPRDVTTIVTGGLHSCALTADQDVFCWGQNDYGQMAEEGVLPRTEPGQIAGVDPYAAAVSAGGFHNCTILDGGNLQCWGQNYHGQLGHGTKGRRALPAGVIGF